MASNKRGVLVIEDEISISNFISAILNANEYSVTVAATGAQALSMFLSHNPDLVVLDLGLPDCDGLEVLSRLREFSQTPVVVVSARGRETEKVEALDLGADDYITKPFGVSELLARIRATLRRADRAAGGLHGSVGIFTAGDLTVNMDKRTVSAGGREPHLTQIEFKIVALLCRNAGKVLTYDYIIKNVWGPYASSEDNQILRVNMANIRRKLEENPAEPRYIVTELGVGYRMLEE